MGKLIWRGREKSKSSAVKTQQKIDPNNIYMIAREEKVVSNLQSVPYGKIGIDAKCDDLKRAWNLGGKMTDAGGGDGRHDEYKNEI